MKVSNKKKFLYYVYLLNYIRNKFRRVRKYEVHPLNHQRKTCGKFFTLINKLEKYPMKFMQYFRMTREQFYVILQRIDPIIKPKHSNQVRKDAILSKEKLVLTLRFLATGSSFVDLAFRFFMGKTTVRNCIIQTMKAINKTFESIIMPLAKSVSDWEKISIAFLEKWNFPNCLGAVDGKHVKMFAPQNSGSMNFNYRKTFSTILMAVVDANYKFVMVSIGAHGSNSDSTIFGHCNFGKAWSTYPERLRVPADCPLPGTLKPMPYVLVGDEAFGLSYNLLTPYPGTGLTMNQRVFNYRLSRARRLVESSFGILTHTWRILLKSLEVQSFNFMLLYFAQFHKNGC